MRATAASSCSSLTCSIDLNAVFYVHFVCLLSAIYLPLFTVQVALEAGTGGDGDGDQLLSINGGNGGLGAGSGSVAGLGGIGAHNWFGRPGGAL